MNRLLPLLILLNCHMIQVSGVLEWTVIGKVTDYGQNVTLFCNVSNCCPKDAGWDRYSPEQRTLFIDIRTGRSNKKYDGKTSRDGYTLIIKNLTEKDLNVSYSCVYGVTIGQSKFLLEEDVFTYIIDTTPHAPPDNSRLSDIKIAGIIVGIVVLVAVSVVLFVLYFRRNRNHRQRDKDEKKALLDRERKEHLQQIILSDECVKHYYARVMFIGKYGVGKTSLMRRLLGLGRHAAINTKSTDGVSISKCMINVQTGKWRPCDKKDDDLARLIKHVFAENKDKTKDNVAHKTKSNKDVADHQEMQQPVKSYLIKTPMKNGSSSTTLNIDVKAEDETKEDNYEATNQTNQEAAVQDDINSQIDEHSEDQSDVNHTRELQRKELDNIDKEVNDSISTASNNSFVQNEECVIRVDDGLCQTTRNDDLNKMTSDIIDKYVKYPDASQPQEAFASCWLWDFAGQNDFYATHQAFLSSCAVYILVADSLEFSAKEELWIDFKESAQYVRFWCDAVHCYCLTTDNEEIEEMSDPAIVIVHTKKDTHKEKSIQEDHHNAFVENIGKVLFGQDQKKHIRDILNVSNTNDEDGVFEKIGKRISELASEMKSWGVEIPLKWFLFQQVIEKLKENKVPISTTKNVQQMASHKYIGITDDADFRKCLLYFHDVGTIIYYDEEGLNENVILDPKWLIDAFRCLVSHQISNETKIGDDWCTLQQTGQITTSLLGKLLQKKTDYTIDFQGHKEYLIEVMKKYDIIVSMKDSPFLYMPCMMTDCSLDFVKGNFITATFDKTSWLCLRFDFLPPVFFNHIIARYMKVYNVISAMDKGKGVIKHALYRKIAVFKLPDSGCKQLILCQAPNILAVQICFSKANDIKDYSKYRKDLDTFVQNLKSRYKLHIVYKVELACKDGDIELGRTSLCDLNEPEYRCKSHKNNIHSSGELLDWWYTKDEFENEQKRIKDHKEQLERRAEQLKSQYVTPGGKFRHYKRK